jgi:thiol-disulfide isomerase/thioredoxin
MMIHSDSPTSSSLIQNTGSQTTQQTSSGPSLVSSSVDSTSTTNSFILTCNPSNVSETSIGQASLNQPISQSLYTELSGVSCVTLSSIGKPQSVSSLKAVSGSALTINGKPEILYIGAEFCPYCAAERWSLIVALSKFGVFTGLEYMMSSSNDIYPNTPTFTFLNATYTSPYISLVTVEAQDRSKAPLQPITSSEQAILDQYDSGISIPFVDISNQFVLVSSQYSPSTLSETTWDQVALQLDNPSNNYAINIDGAANLIISDICAVDGNNPSVICDQSFAKISSFFPAFVPILGNVEIYFETIGILVLLAIALFPISPFTARCLKHRRELALNV